MSSETNNLINTLVQLSLVDASLARILSERLQIENEVNQKRRQLKSENNNRLTTERKLLELRQKAKEEDAYVKHEQDKLVNRRKTLANMSNYKLQEAATREVDALAKQLELREEQTLSLLMEVEKVENILNDQLNQISTLEAALKEFEITANEKLQGLANRKAEKDSQRAGLSAQVDPNTLSRYNSIATRYPSDSLVPLKANACTGCSVSLGPQVYQKVARGNSLVQCGNCGRILYIEPESQSAPQAGSDAV